MTEHKKQSRLRNLLKKWTLTSQKKESLHIKAAELEPKKGGKLSLLRKVSAWMEQIATLQRKEDDIISEIMDIEKKHQMLRKNKKLRRAEPQKTEPDGPETTSKDRFWLWLMMIILFFRNKKKPDAPKNG